MSPVTSSLPANGHIVKGLMRPYSVDTSTGTSEEHKTKRRFTLGKKAKKPKRRSRTSDAIKELQTMDSKTGRSGTLPTGSSVDSGDGNPSSGLNWSVPEDLPGVTASPTSSQAPSLDNMFFTLSPSSLQTGHYASNPDIIHTVDGMDPGHFIIFRPQKTVGHGLAHSFEAAVQVGAKEEVQRFPSPPVYSVSSSVGSCVPGIRYISPSPSSSYSNSRHATPIRSLPVVVVRDGTPVQAGEGEVSRESGETRHVASYQILSGQDDASDEENDDTYGKHISPCMCCTDVNIVLLLLHLPLLLSLLLQTPFLPPTRLPSPPPHVCQSL